MESMKSKLQWGVNEVNITMWSLWSGVNKVYITMWTQWSLFYNVEWRFAEILFYKDQLTEIDMTIWSGTWSTEVNEV